MNKFHYLLLLNILLTIKAVEISENETEDEIELKENAENVCIDQEVQNKILNITYIQSIVSTLFLFFNKMFQTLRIQFSLTLTWIGVSESTAVAATSTPVASSIS